MSTGSTFFFFNDTATTEIYTLSLHDALPILTRSGSNAKKLQVELALKIAIPFICLLIALFGAPLAIKRQMNGIRSEEHTSELQSLRQLVCRLLLGTKKTGHRYRGAGRAQQSH